MVVHLDLKMKNNEKLHYFFLVFYARLCDFLRYSSVLLKSRGRTLHQIIPPPSSLTHNPVYGPVCEAATTTASMDNLVSIWSSSSVEVALLLALEHNMAFDGPSLKTTTLFKVEETTFAPLLPIFLLHFWTFFAKKSLGNLRDSFLI